MPARLLGVEEVDVLKLPSLVCRVSSVKRSIASISSYTLKSHLRSLLPMLPVHEKFSTSSSTAVSIEYFYDNDSFVSAVRAVQGTVLYINSVELHVSVIPPETLTYNEGNRTVVFYHVPGKVLQLNIAAEEVPETHPFFNAVSTCVGPLTAMAVKPATTANDMPLYVDIYLKFSRKADMKSVHVTLLQFNSNVLLKKADKYYLVGIAYDTSEYMSSTSMQRRRIVQEKRQEAIDELIYWRDSSRRLLGHIHKDTADAWSNYLHSPEGESMKLTIQQDVNDMKTALRQIDSIIERRDNSDSLQASRDTVQRMYYQLLDTNATMQRNVSEYNEHLAMEKRREQELELQQIYEQSYNNLQQCVNKANQLLNSCLVECCLLSAIANMVHQLSSHVATANKLLRRKNTPVAALQTSQQIIEVEISKVQPYHRMLIRYCNLTSAAANLKGRCEIRIIKIDSLSGLIRSYMVQQLEGLLRVIVDAFMAAGVNISAVRDMNIARHACMLQWMLRLEEFLSQCCGIENEILRLDKMDYVDKLQSVITAVKLAASEKVGEAWKALSDRWNILIANDDNDWDYSLMRRMMEMLDDLLMEMFAIWEQAEQCLMSEEDKSSAKIRAVEVEAKERERKREIDGVYWMTLEDKRGQVLRKIDRLMKRKAELEEDEASFADRWHMDQTSRYLNVGNNDAPTLPSIIGYVSCSVGLDKEAELRDKVLSKKRHRLVTYH